MDQAGIATLAVIVVLIAATVGTIGTPLIVDAVDVQPDSPLYSLERAGESIKGAFAGGQDWEIERAQERDDEFVYMVGAGKAGEYTWLVEESDVHLLKAAKLADDNEGLQKAIEANVFHLVLLENVKERVPAEVKPAISFAQLQSYASTRVLENVAMEVHLKIPEPLKVELDNRLGQIRVAIENLRIENVGPPEFTIRIENYEIIRPEQIELEVENAYAVSVIENLQIVIKKPPIEIKLLKSLRIEPHNAWLGVDDFEDFTATVVYSDGSTQNVTLGATWELSNPAVGNIFYRVCLCGCNYRAVFHAEKIGYTWITANYHGYSDSIPVVVSEFPSPEYFGKVSLTAISDEEEVLYHILSLPFPSEITTIIGGSSPLETLYIVDAIGRVGDMPPNLCIFQVYFKGSHGIKEGDNLTGFGAYWGDGYIDAFSDGFWIAKVVHVEENAWVWTDKNSYQMGETVTIYFKNLAEEPLIFGVMPTWHIERYEDGSWKSVRIYPPDTYWILLLTGIEPSEIKSSMWDQKIYIGSRENYEEIQTEPGRYRVVWSPENLETGEPVGEFKSEFRIANIIIYWPENFIAIGPATLNDSGATPQTVAEVVDGNNKFAFDLYSQLAGEEGNVFFSPWSISTALAMTYEGARGQTAEEMESVLHLPENDDARRPSFAWIHNRLNVNKKEYELESANALWAQEGYPFLDSYFSIIENYYGGKIANLDFKSKTEEARRTINDWVSEKTRGKIEELIEEGTLDQFTRLVLTNAIYFKGEWVKQFNENATHPEDFWVEPGRTVEVPMMSLTGENVKFNYMETEELKALEMPYKGEDLSMLILLPKTKFGLSDLEENINPSRLNEIRKGLKEQKVNVCMPKFEFNTKYELPKTLEEMGMISAFLEGIANFSGMDGTRDLFIQSVIHEAFVKVDEKGAEVAAATGVGVGVGIVPPEKTFHADHPFMFIIQEKGTGNILFLGRVVNPSK